MKLSGFTLSRFLGDSGVYTLQQEDMASKWTAPESYLSGGKVTCKSDVWGKWLSVHMLPWIPVLHVITICCMAFHSVHM